MATIDVLIKQRNELESRKNLLLASAKEKTAEATKALKELQALGYSITLETDVDALIAEELEKAAMAIREAEEKATELNNQLKLILSGGSK